MAKKRVLLSFSGGLDTSWCVLHLLEQGYEVSTVTFDVGGVTDEDREEIRQRAEDCGAQHHRWVDMRERLCDRFVVPLLQSGYRKNGNYPLCVGTERGLQAERLGILAMEGNFDAVAHGCTAAGNDQVRFDVTLRTILPSTVPILAPIRDLGPSREECAEQLKQAGLSVDKKTTEYSINTSLWGTTLGGGVLHNPEEPIPYDIRYKVRPFEETPKEAEEVAIAFHAGIPNSVNGDFLWLPEIIERLNRIGADHGVGRDIHTGDTVLGIKGRVVFEAPGAFLLHRAHDELMRLTLGKRQLQFRVVLANTYGQLMHEGLWLDPMMRDIESYLAHEQRRVNGVVTLRLYRGTVELVRLVSGDSRMNDKIRYGEHGDGWVGRDTEGFARILALGIKT